MTMFLQETRQVRKQLGISDEEAKSIAEVLSKNNERGIIVKDAADAITKVIKSLNA